MANGQRTAAALSGATAGAALGPVGAGIGGIAAYAAASIGSLFGHKKKKPPPPPPWYVTHATALVVGGAGAVVTLLVVVVVIKKRKE